MADTMDMSDMMDSEHPQRPATGEHADGYHALNVEEEAKAHGIDLTPIGGHGQGGKGH
jgi:hypothetical protein